MVKLSVNDLVHGEENCYSLVAAISKRAREIAEELREEGNIEEEEKPVQLAVKEFINGQYRIVQPDLNAQAKKDAEEERKKREEEELVQQMRKKAPEGGAENKPEKPKDDGKAT